MEESYNYAIELVYSEIGCNENMLLTNKKNGCGLKCRDVGCKIYGCDKGNRDITNNNFFKQ